MTSQDPMDNYYGVLGRQGQRSDLNCEAVSLGGPCECELWPNNPRRYRYSTLTL